MTNISLNPMQTTNAAGLFGIKSQGWYQGVALDDPAARFALSAGYVASTETLPMWGGLAITEFVPGLTARPYGAKIQRATSLDNLTGFTVFNQANNGLVTPQSVVPTYSGDMSVSFYRFGSGARVPLPVSAAVIEQQADGLPVNFPLVWNFTTGQLDVFATVAADVATTGITISGAGMATATTASAHGVQPGSFVTINGAVPGGYNGTYQVASVPSATTFTYVPATTPTGAATTQGEVTPATASDVKLPVEIIGIQEGNCKVVAYNAGTNYATWNPNGNLACVLL